MSDLLGDLRGVLYDWKSESIVSSASAFINHAKLVDEKINLCNEHGFADVIRGLDFYNDWLASHHKQLLTFISDLQSIWEWYSKASDKTLHDYENIPNLRESPECKAAMLGENRKFLLIAKNTLECTISQRRIDLWANNLTDGFATLRVRDNVDNCYAFLTLIPANTAQEVSQAAIKILLDVLNTTQTTNQTSSERNNV